MMDIIVNGTNLDIYPQETVMSWKSFVFADAVGDQFSTDIELPRTRRNSEALEPFGVLDGLNHFQQRIPCAVSFDVQGCDGYLQVSAIRRDSITATLYLSPLPYGVIDAQIRYLVHDTNYIREWDLAAPTSLTSGHNPGLQRSLFVNDMGVRVVPWSLDLAMFLAVLTNSTGATIDNLDIWQYSGELRIVAAVPKVSPYNTRQTLYSYDDPDDPVTRTYASQHVCCNVDSPREYVTDYITVTRKCTVKFTPYSMGVLQVVVGGVASSVTYSSYENLTSPGTPVTYQMDAGDMYYYGPTGMAPYTEAVCLVEFSGYDTSDVDTDTLVFPGYIDGEGGTPLEVPRYAGYLADGQGGRVRLSWSYMDYWWCIGSLTIRELLNTICHLAGLPLEKTGSVLGYGAAKAKDLGGDAEITEIRPYTQSLGVLTRLAYNQHSGRPPQELLFTGDFIPDEVTVFQSVFFGAKETPNGVALVPMFESDGSNTMGCTWQDCGPVMLVEMSYVQGGTTYYGLAPLPDMSWMGINNKLDPVEVSIETYDDLRGYTYCYIEGHKYILIEAETDADTGLCTATALLTM